MHVGHDKNNIAILYFGWRVLFGLHAYVPVAQSASLSLDIQNFGQPVFWLTKKKVSQNQSVYNSPDCKCGERVRCRWSKWNLHRWTRIAATNLPQLAHIALPPLLLIPNITSYHHKLSSPAVIPAIITSCRLQLSSLAIITSCHHQLSTPAVITIYHHQLSPPAIITSYHHQLSPPAVTTSYHHQLSSPATITSYRHQLSSPAIITSYCHQLSSPAIITSCRHQLSSPAIITSCHHQLSSPAVIISCHHQLSLPAIITSYHHSFFHADHPDTVTLGSTVSLLQPLSNFLNPGQLQMVYLQIYNLSGSVTPGGSTSTMKSASFGRMNTRIPLVQDHLLENGEWPVLH